MKPLTKNISSLIKYCENELSNTFDLVELNSTIAILFEHFIGMTRTEIVLNRDRVLTNKDSELILMAVESLKTKKPLAYVLGEWEFYGLKFKINENTLIPRPETEELVQMIIEDYKEKGAISVLDIGTGSGCIALSLKANLPEAKVIAWDISEYALEKVKENIEINALQVEISQVDILSQPFISGKLDVIVSNPPYIPVKEKSIMKENVLSFEPHLALFVNDHEPLIFYVAIADFALKYLNKSGKLYFEINENYGEEVKNMLDRRGFNDIELIKDINDRKRMVKCYL